MPAGALLATAEYGLPPLPIRQGYVDPRRIWLEADGMEWRPSIEGIILPGATGMGLPPVEVISEPVPGVAGSTLVEVRVGEREVYLPIYLATEGTPEDFIDAKTEFEDMLWPLGRAAPTLRIVAQDHTGIRELPVTYVEGLTGDEGRTAAGARWATVGLRFRAVNPYWQARQDTPFEAGVAGPKDPFLGAHGAPNTAPWPRRLAGSTVLGMGMVVNVRSAVPVYPTAELTGPMNSFEASADTGWHIRVPDPIPAGQTLRIVSEPRRKSVRLGGLPAAGRIDLGGALKPFQPGENILDVLAPGGDENTLVRLTWREQYRSAWGGR